MWQEQRMAEIRQARMRELQADTDDEEDLDQKNREEEEQERRRLEREQHYMNEFRKAPMRPEHEELFKQLQQQEQLEKRVLEKLEYQGKEAEQSRRRSQAEDPEVQRGISLANSDDEVARSLVRAAVLGAEQTKDKHYLHTKGAEIQREFREKKMQIQDVSLQFLQALDVAGNAKERKNTFLLLHEFVHGQQNRGLSSCVVQFFLQLERLNLPVQEKRYYGSFVRHPVQGNPRPSFFMELGGEGDDDDDAQSLPQFLAEWCDRMCPLPSQAPTTSPKRQKTKEDI